MANDISDESAAAGDRNELEREAERLYSLYVARNPRDLLGYAGFLAQLNRLDEAIDLCERAASDAPSAAVLAAAVDLLRKGQPSTAHFQRIDVLVKEAGERSPDSTWWLWQLAALRDLEGRYDEAIDVYRRLLEQNRSDVVSLNNLAWFLAAWKGEHEEARRLIELAIETSGPVPQLLDTLGFVLLQLGQAEQAVEVFERVVAEHDTPRDRYNLALAHWKADDHRAAEFNWQRATAAGFQVQMLHPLEQNLYQEFASQMRD
jgi:tetratricopeptide (TPR) repeat protein